MPTIIGLTGAFGTGCTTAASHLRDKRKFRMITLSDVIRSEWKKRHPRKVPLRLELQRLGDELRRERGAGVLVDLALETLSPGLPQLVIDGVRNTGEVASLRKHFGLEFTFIAILASSDARWGRIGAGEYTRKGLTQNDFVEDEKRDFNEETEWGQQVELCIDKADVVIDNSADVSLNVFKEKVLRFVDLATGEVVRPPEAAEILMNMAYSASHSSRCAKRHVGAVIVDGRDFVVGVGYNDNPHRTKPCTEEAQYNFRCFRDGLRNKHFGALAQSKVRCPVCGKRLREIEGPPWRCVACEERGKKTNLESFFFPDRAASWCTAIHAEVWALMAAGGRARDAVLYATTFPCFQCAEKIIHAGIRKVCYTEAYPDVASAHRLRLGGVELVQFEGVRSTSFERIFASNRPW